MNVSLEVSHLANEVLNNLRGKLLEHLILGPSQDERGDTLLEALDCVNEELGLFQLFRESLDV